MKKTLLYISALFAVAIQAQTSSDAYEFSNSQLYGTARYNALSGAFGALGGDLSAINDNPAASAVFSSSKGGITLSQGGSVYTSDYTGDFTETEDANFNFNQLGAVLVLKDTNKSSGLEQFALAFNYNKESDFRDEYSFGGFVNSTIGDYFVGQANGYFNGDIQRIDDETYTDAYIEIGDLSGFGRVGQEAFLGYTSYLIDPGTTDYDYVSNSDASNTYQEIDIVQSGSKGKTSLNMSGAFTSGLHVGANLNLHWFERNKSMIFLEENNFASVQYEILNESVSGGGVSFGFGGIYKTDANLRVGLSYQTPTWYSVITTIDQRIDTAYAEEIEIVDDEDVVVDSFTFLAIDPQVVYQYLDDYSYKTPAKLTASLAYVIGKKGLISAEYSRQNFGNIKYGDELVGYDVLNQTIEELYDVVNTFRLGSEVRLDKWSLRAGGWNKSSQFQDEETFGGGSFGYSLGVGYNWGKWQLDASYNHFEREYSVTPFENDLYSNTAITTEKGDLVSVTLGVNF